MPDAGNTLAFQDVTALLNADGTFSFDESQLGDLTYDGLVDGTYTLRLQVQTTTNQTIEKSIQFQLDRSTPTVSLPDVIDGIAWERGMHFLGTVQDNANAVQMVYEIARASDGQSVAQHSFTVAGSLTGTAFDQVLDELTSGNSVLQDEEVYNLIVTSTDVAGNAQRTRFQFFIPGDRRVVDDDPWISPTNPNDPPTDPRTPIPGVTPTAGNLSSWGYVGSGGGWGYYGGSGSGGGWTPGYDGQLTPEGKDDHRGLTGTGYEYEYAESVDAIVRQAVDLISTSPATIHQKAALQNRQNILLAIGDRLNTLIQADGNFANDQALIDQMRPAMEGLFADAYDPNGYRAGVYDTFVPWGGAWLAQELVQDSRSVREQVFQATLLEVVTETFATRQIAMSQAQQSALTAAVLELAKTYTWLNPNPETTVPTEGEAFGFLDLLWRLQVPDANGQFKGNGDIATALGQAVTQLGQLLEGVNDPVRAIQFINNLMQAAANVPSLKNDLKDAQFLRELIEFGFEFVRSNPTVNQTAPDAAVQGFLDRLWRADTQQVRQAQGGLSAFFAGMDTEAEKIKGLDFAVSLLDAAELLQGEGLEAQKKDTAFLDALIGLGGAYAAFDPQLSAEGEKDPRLFLNTLRQIQDFQKMAEELKAFLQQTNTLQQQVRLLNFERDLLKTLNLAVVSDQEFQNPILVNNLINSSALYTLYQAEIDQSLLDYNPIKLFPSVWNIQETSDLQMVATSLKNQIDDYKNSFSEEDKLKQVDVFLTLCMLHPEICRNAEKIAQCTFDALLGKPCTVSQKAIDLLKKHETFVSTLYDNDGSGAGNCTIGYGHLVHEGPCDGTESEEFRQGISQQRALEFLAQDLKVAENDVRQYVKVPLNQNQFDALVSFAFNVGGPQFGSSDVVAILNQATLTPYKLNLRKYEEAARELETEYDNAPGLPKRRKDEANLFRGKL